MIKLVDEYHTIGMSNYLEKSCGSFVYTYNNYIGDYRYKWNLHFTNNKVRIITS